MTAHKLTELLGLHTLTIQAVFASSDEISTPSATVLSSDCILQQQFQGGTSMVNPKSPDFQWALPNSASTFFDNKDGYIQEWLGSSLSENSNRRGMEFRETTTSYKRIGNEGCKISFASISQAVSD